MTGDELSEPNSSVSDRLSRRRVLQAATALSVGLAGCGGGGGGEGTDGGGAGGDPTETTGTTAAGVEFTQTPAPTDESTVQQEGQPVTTELASQFGAWDPDNTNFNFYSPAGNQPPFSTYLWNEGTLYRNNSGQITYHTIDDVGFADDGKQVTFKFNEGYTWWDGTDVTAEDYLIQRRINQFQQHGSLEAAPVELELVNDYTVRENRSTAINPTVRLLNHVQALYTKRDVYREWLEKYEDAGGEEAVDGVTEELSQHQISMDEFANDGLGCGMWRPVEWNPQRVTYEKHTDHPRSEWTDLETWTWELIDGDQKADQAFQNDRFDMGEISFKNVRQSDTYESIGRFGLPGVPKLTINFSNKHLGRRGVRRAIAYLLDHDELRNILEANYGTPYKGHPYINGMAAAVGRNQLGTDHLEKLIDYGSSAEVEKATAAMKDAGYSKQGDVWVGPDGDSVEGIRYMSPPWDIYQSIQQYFASKLTDFGIDTEVVQPSRANFYSRLNDSYDFDLLNWYHFGFHPVNNYYIGAGTPTGLDTMETAVEGESTADSPPELNAERTQRLNQPIRPAFPSEAGSLEIDGEGQTLYPIQWNEKMSQTQDRAVVEELGRKLSWYYNWQLPHVGFYEEVWQYWGNPDRHIFKGTAPDHPNDDRVAREYSIPNEDAIQVWQGHVSSRLE
jgi:ABC-type transport system substrate-binding protein